MKRPPRPVIVAAVTGSVARLVAVDNGALTTADVADLVRAAGVQPRQTAGAVLVPARSLPDVEALARVRRVVFQRRKGAPTAEGPAFRPAARPGIDDAPEPVHACAGAVCRVPRCRAGRAAS